MEGRGRSYPDDIPLEIAPATSSDSSPPVTLHRSSSGASPSASKQGTLRDLFSKEGVVVDQL